MIAAIFAGDQTKIHDLDELLALFPAPLRNHSRRVAICSAIIAEYTIDLLNVYDIPTANSLPMIAYLGGTCHDIGKLMLPANDVREDEYLMHPSLGADLLEKYKDDLFESERFAQMVLDIVRYHHEHSDGSGFPKGLRAGDIPLTAEICLVADKLDHHMYTIDAEDGKSSAVCRSLEWLKAEAGKQFCECILVCVERAWPNLSEKYASWNHYTDSPK